MNSRLSIWIAFAIAAAATTPVTALADAGHGHVRTHEEQEGHAAMLGRPGDARAKARSVSITTNDNMRFAPDTISVKRGETIRFIVKNGGELKHEMVLGTAKELAEHAKLMVKFPEMEHDDPNAVTVEPGQTQTLLWTFTKSGNFDFACLIPGHFQSGMRGKIVVK